MKNRARALVVSHALLLVFLAFVGGRALGGEFVYDDLRMAHNRFMDDPSDMLATFSRNSADYLLASEPLDGTPTTGATYRPLAQFSLVAVQVISGAPLAHHALSFALHALTSCLLLLGLVRLTDKPLAAFALAAAFTLHPAVGETWLYINGRADLMADLALATTLCLLAAPERGARNALALPLTLLFGMLSKETFVVSAGCLVLAFALRPGRTFTARLGPLVTLLAAVGTWLVLARLAAAHYETAGAEPASLDVGVLFARAPKLIALGFGRVFVPFASPMHALAYDLEAPLSLPVMAGYVAFVGLAYLFIQHGRYLALLVGLGAAATLVPTGFVADAFWLGLDRYVAPVVLLVVVAIGLALATVPTKAPSESAESPRARWATAVGLALALCLAVPLHATAGFYRGQRAFSWSMMNARPLDPSGHLLYARLLAEGGHPSAAWRVLQQAPRTRIWPLELARVQLFAALGDSTSAMQGLELVLEAHPDEPRLFFAGVQLRLSQRRFDEAFALADRAVRDPRSCRSTKRLLEALGATRQAPEDRKEAVRRILRRARC